MPQFDPSTFASQLFWLAITFSILYLIVWKFIIPKINYILEMRENVVVNDLERAKELKIEAEKILQDYETAINNAFEKRNLAINKVIDDCKKDTEIKNSELNKEIEEKIVQSEKRIFHAKDEAIKEIDQIATDITHKAVSSLIGLNVDRNNVKNIVDNILKEII